MVQRLSALDKSQLWRIFAPVAGIGILAYLAWRMVAPFLPAICWAFALAIIAHPVYIRLVNMLKAKSLAAVAAVLLILTVIILPSTLLGKALLEEAMGMIRLATADPASIRSELEKTAFTGRLFQWVDARVDLAGEATDVLHSALASLSELLSSFIAGSMRFFAQIGVTVFVLFYFLRDHERILAVLRRLIPIRGNLADAVFARIVQIIRVSLGGKFVTATIQGVLGGAIFAWVGLPAPVFWGFVMGALSLFPVIGAFLVWGPAALVLLFKGNWPHAVLMTAWGIVVIHPVDNLLGPILVGTTLRLHTLLMFFSILGGLAAFGPAGIVIGPVVVAVAVSVYEESTSAAPRDDT
jgi:predicted PurR-regulated permease PerM